MMNDLLAACERAIEHASKEPWHAVQYASWFMLQDGPGYDARDLLSYGDVLGDDGVKKSTPEQAKANAELCALSRSALPTLVARVRELELEAKLAAVRAECGQSASEAVTAWAQSVCLPETSSPSSTRGEVVKKRNRLFLIGDLTDDVRWYCGGPDPAEATAGIIDILYDRVVDMLANGGTCELRLCVKQLTDKEVEELPEP